MEVVLTVVNAVFLAFIVSTMLSVGLATTVARLGGVVGNVRWIGGALVASLIVVPLVGWGLAEAFPLEGANYIALVLVASSPGAPFAVALVGIQRGDVVAVATTMAILAMIGSVTTALTVELIVSSSDLADAGGGSINVGELVLSIVVLQLVPLGVGMAMRAWVPDTADHWLAPAKKTSSMTFAVVGLAVVIGGFQQVIDLIGSWLLPAAFVAALAWMAAGALLSPPPQTTRQGAALLASSRNAGPVLLIAAVSFADVEGVMPAVIAVFVVLLATQIVVASWFGRRAPVPAGERAA